jgi:V/A-type H+-transporting ATPase subunit E
MAEEFQGILDKIHKDGQEVAAKAKAEVLSKANEAADKIVAEAKEKADQMIQEAQKEADLLVQKGNAALAQASRDVIISLKASIEEAVATALAPVVQSSMDSATLSKIITDMVKGFATSGFDVEKGIEALLPEASLKDLEKTAYAALKDELGSSFVLKPVKSIAGGVQVKMAGSDASYDISAETVTEMICAYLNPQIVKVIKNN